jgi:5-methylthioribose kinase
MGFFQAKAIDSCLDFKIEHGEVLEIDISLVDVGNLNYVYKITLNGITGYLKQALTEYRKSFPGEKELPLKEDRLANEVAALKQLNALDVSGFTFPSVLSYDAAHNLVLLSEITGKTLLSYFLEGVFDEAHASAAGDALGLLHAVDAAGIRKDDDAFFKEIVRFRSVVSSHALGSEHQKLIAERFDTIFADGFPKSLLIGDFSPKQLLLSGGSVGVVDLEFACKGDAAFDVGFFLAHYVLEEMKGADSGAVEGAMKAFIEAYGKHVAIEGMKSRILFYMGAGLLNRVDGTVRGGDINEAIVAAIRERSIKIISGEVTYGMG